MEINQAYAGDSGGLFAASNTTVLLLLPEEEEGAAQQEGSVGNPKPVPVPAHQLFAKRLDKNRVAVLLMNSAETTADLVVSFQQLWLPPRGHDPQHVVEDAVSYHVRDVWNHKDLGVFANEWTVAVPAHDAAFVVVEPASSSATESR